MKAYNLRNGILIENNQAYFLLPQTDWDSFINRDDLYDAVSASIQSAKPVPDASSYLQKELLPPIGNQEVWASGVTYLRSKIARQEESEEAGGGDFYDRVYSADRPELFFKATPNRVVGSGQGVNIRKDSTWNVPEPELALVITSNGKIVGYTVGNDMSSRSIEGENPLYLPQAKTYDKSCGLGPCVYITQQPISRDSKIEMIIQRNDKRVFNGEITLQSLKRKEEELVGYLYKECSFPQGSILLTGTGIVPDNDFTLQSGDIIRITIEHIGTLVNTVN
ncbi:fumarylacetoacetate hydrolase family protein [Rhodocytophaga aerolata]|uniref:Fumarylacetoacetate hydrolase family protein n=1 Tax=Rhodocytophaga aerolata TaxID=455078 RepID=A0ABT8RA90_9BACT|nr:fumarylacetoacetate hydrolase family protein [Rhodocytophaga aerolata]MDO1448909.1 fumarylacetoacetate hydrolase family protein [Rhodocytophaga aerolata]